MYNPKTIENKQKGTGLSDFATYLKDEMGLFVACEEWSGAEELPLFLSKAADYRLCSCNGVSFIAAVVEQGTSLPGLKRIAAQVSARSGLPVALVSQIDPRQRRALVSQGVAFVVPGRQVFLPMLGFVVATKADRAPLAQTLAPGAQAVLVALVANPTARTLADLMGVTGMPSSSVSRALDDLSRRGLVEKSRSGREVIVERDGDRCAMVRSAMRCLRSPVVRTLCVRKGGPTDALPLAGESALSRRSMLAAPRVEQRAAPRKGLAALTLEEVLPGELPDDESVLVQVWSYDPLVAGGDDVDDVSLALSLADSGDERVIGQLNALFGEELWQ